MKAMILRSHTGDSATGFGLRKSWNGSQTGKAAACTWQFSADMESLDFGQTNRASHTFQASARSNDTFRQSTASLAPLKEKQLTLPRISQCPSSTLREASRSSPAPAVSQWMPKFPDDQFSRMEKDVAHEINLCRCDPQAYSRAFEENYVMEGQFLISKPAQETRQHMQRLVDQLRRNDENYDSQRLKREHVWNSRKEELLAMIAATKKTKGGKKAPAKKDTREPSRTGAAQVEDNPEEVLEREQQRFDSQEQALKEDHLAARLVAEEEIEHIQAALMRVDACICYLAAQSPLPWLEYSRGLALAGRAHPVMRKSSLPERPGRASSIEERAERYGTAIGSLAEVTFHGVESAQQIVASLILEEFERLESARPQGIVFLHNRFAQIGVGWGQHITQKRMGLCVIALAERFMENRAIRERHHLDLQCLIRELEHCSSTRHNTTQIVMKHIPAIGHIRMLQPTEHPLEVAQRGAEISMEIPGDVVLAACLDRGGPPSSAVAVALDDAVFVQHLGAEAIIHVALPAPGMHRLLIFAKKKGSLRYEELGFVTIRAKFNPSTALQVGFPKSYTAFGDLRCYLVSPVQNPLKADSVYSFELEVSVDRQAELEQELQVAEDRYSEQMSAIAMLHSQELRSIATERQELESELTKLATPDHVVEKMLPSPERKGRRGTDKPKTPQAPTPKRVSKKGPELVEPETKAISEKQEQDRAAVKKRLATLEEKEMLAIQELELQQKWMQEQLEKSRQDVHRRQTQRTEVTLLNNDHKHMLAEKPEVPNRFVAHRIKVQAGAVSLLVDGTFLVSWRVEHSPT